MEYAVGQYIRCPVYEEDEKKSIMSLRYPRNFIIAQITDINEFADEVIVEIHDYRDSRLYYKHVFAKTAFSAKDKNICRCRIAMGAHVSAFGNEGTVIAQSRVLKKNDIPVMYSYYVKFDNGSIKKVYEDDISCPYVFADINPLKQLRNYELHNPTYFLERYSVGNCMHMMNNMFYGFKLLAGCRAFMLPHQSTTITRALERNTVRYMLADEVGLGKTVEAAGIIKIMQNDNPDMRVLYIIPDVLIGQWISELWYKFYSKAEVFSEEKMVAPVLIIPMSCLNKSSVWIRIMCYDWDMLVVDETHRLLKNQIWYDIVYKLCRKVENVLLLSATPIQDRSNEYLKLLCLLDPARYGDMSQEHFDDLVAKQKLLQNKVVTMYHAMQEVMEEMENNPEDMDEELVQECLDDICDNMMEVQEKLLHDGNLERLINDIKWDITGIDGIGQAISYISENFRIERCVIRNRREGLKNVALGRRTLTEIAYETGTIEDSYERASYEALLEMFEEHELTDEYIINVVQPLMAAVFSSPWAVEEVVQCAGIEIDPYVEKRLDMWKRSVNNELNPSGISDCFDNPDIIKERFMRVIDHISFELCDSLETDTSSNKIVIFSQYKSTLMNFEKALQSWRSLEGDYAMPDGCSWTVFVSGMSAEELEENVDKFQCDDSCRIMLCDETGGEGRNFQNASHIIHLDLPWTANAIEQRIGRLDRLGRDEDSLEVNSVVIHSVDTVEENLFAIWNEGMNIFSESLSGLEIITEELNTKIVESMKDSIREGLRESLPYICEQTQVAKLEVENERVFDITAFIFKPMENNIQEMLEDYNSDTRDNIFHQAMIAWANHAGLHPSNGDQGNMTVFNRNDFNTSAAMHVFLTKPRWEAYDASKIKKINGQQIIGTFDRQTAIKQEESIFFAPSDHVFDHIMENAVNSSRGRCTAMYISREILDFTGFIFVYKISPDIYSLLEKGISQRILGHYRMFLPLKKIVVAVPVNGGNEVDSKCLDKFLNTPHLSSKLFEHIGKRKNGNIEKFIQKYPRAEWYNMISTAKREADSRVKNMFREQMFSSGLKREMLRAIDGYRSEYYYLRKDVSELDNMVQPYNELYGKLTKPDLDYDAVCYVEAKE